MRFWSVSHIASCGLLTSGPLSQHALTPGVRGGRQMIVRYYVLRDGDFSEGVRFSLEVRTLPVDPGRALGKLREAGLVLDMDAPPNAPDACPYCGWASRVAAL